MKDKMMELWRINLNMESQQVKTKELDKWSKKCKIMFQVAFQRLKIMTLGCTLYERLSLKN